MARPLALPPWSQGVSSPRRSLHQTSRHGGSRLPRKHRQTLQGTCGFGPNLAQPHCHPILSVTVTPAPVQMHCGRAMPGGAFHWGIFEDNAPGPHQRRPKPSLSSSPKPPAGARGEEDRAGAAGDGAGLRGTPPPAGPGQWLGHAHLRPSTWLSSPHPCSPSRLTSPELRARTPRFDSRKPESSDPAG